MRIHTFDNATEAYDATQTDEAIADGDILVVTPENVVGFLVKAWPVAVTREAGTFHRFTDEGVAGYEASQSLARDIARVIPGARVEANRPATPRCSCEWADDVGDPEVGPDPYIVSADEACPVHGREVEPEIWAAMDREEERWASYCEKYGIDPNEGPKYDA